jgi:transposase InsO family protein
VSEEAREYLERTSAAMAGGYTADCVVHACALAELLLGAGRAPWIGRLRYITRRGDQQFHEPLVPLRFRGTTWNTHYVCCCDGEVYDPIPGRTVAVDDYAREVFGVELEIAEHLSAEETARMAREGTLKEAFRVKR